MLNLRGITMVIPCNHSERKDTRAEAKRGQEFRPLASNRVLTLVILKLRDPCTAYSGHGVLKLSITVEWLRDIIHKDVNILNNYINLAIGETYLDRLIVIDLGIMYVDMVECN